MLNKIKSNGMYILEAIIMFVILSYAMLVQTFNRYNYVKFDMQSLCILFISLILVIIFTILVNKFKNIDIAKKFLIYSSILGIIFLVAFPIDNIPDEGRHYKRAYEISTGHLVSKYYKKSNAVGNKLDKNLDFKYQNTNYENEWKNISRKESKIKVVQDFANTALYSFVSYIPQSIGIFISRIFTNRILIQLLFGRLLNLICYLLLIYYAIKLIPFKKELLFFIGMLPICIQEAASLSPDAMAIAFPTFFISYILYLRNSNKKIKKHELLILSLSSIYISQLKLVYLPVCLALFLIPDSKFTSKKKRILILMTIFIISILLNLIWLKISAQFLQSYRNSSQAQLKYIISNPHIYSFVCFRSISDSFTYYLYGSFGRFLGTLSIFLPEFLIFGNVLIYLYMSLVNNGIKKELSIKEKSIVALIVISIIGLIFTSLYIQWTPFKNLVVEGIHGRYFTPILMFISLLLITKKMNSKYNLSNRYIDLFIVLENVCAIAMIITNFI